MKTHSPSVTLNRGLEIGYTSPLVHLAQTVQLAGGTHFLLARNGRGKTTLLRTLARSIKPIRGNFDFHGFMQYLPEDLRFDLELPPEAIFRTMIPKSRRKDALALADKIELDLKKPYGQLSTGNRRKTNLIMAEFSIRPDAANILLLDEPFSGLDAFAHQAFEELWRASSDNVLRLVSCHPDYDSMELPSALILENNQARHIQASAQTWSQLKTLLN
jgi:ABC-type multidrug transport system ATPase subunit